MKNFRHKDENKILICKYFGEDNTQKRASFFNSVNMV